MNREDYRAKSRANYETLCKSLDASYQDFKSKGMPVDRLIWAQWVNWRVRRHARALLRKEERTVAPLFDDRKNNLGFARWFSDWRLVAIVVVGYGLIVWRFG